MSDVVASTETFASGRYSKRKRTQVTYYLDELDVSDSESDFDNLQAKKHKAETTPKRLPKRKIFSFMELPAEIRNIIYTYALTDPSGINFVATFKHRRRTVERISAQCMEQVAGGYRRYSNIRVNDVVRAQQEEPTSLVPSLLAVSKQIYSEGLDILYSNEFVFADSFAMYAFLINLGPARAKHLKTLRLLEWGHGRAMKAYNHSCFAVLVWATNMTAFHIDAHMYTVKHGSQQLYRDAFPWLEAIGSAKGKADAAVELLHIGEDSLSGSWGWAPGPAPTSHETKVKQFKAALSTLLEKQQKRVMAKPAKKRMLIKDVIADEL